jgi:hypothetical protein
VTTDSLLLGSLQQDRQRARALEIIEEGRRHVRRQLIPIVVQAILAEAALRVARGAG